MMKGSTPSAAGTSSLAASLPFFPIFQSFLPFASLPAALHAHKRVVSLQLVPVQVSVSFISPTPGCNIKMRKVKGCFTFYTSNITSSHIPRDRACLVPGHPQWARCKLKEPWNSGSREPMGTPHVPKSLPQSAPEKLHDFRSSLEVTGDSASQCRRMMETVKSDQKVGENICTMGRNAQEDAPWSSVGSPLLKGWRT